MAPFRFVDPRGASPPPPGACAVGIVAKVPRGGSVKTRLVPPLSADEAAALGGCFLRDVAAAVEEAAASVPAIRGVAVYHPPGEEAGLDGLVPPGFPLLAQRGADLGERLRNAVDDLLAAGYRSACLVNSDSPTLPASLLAEAARALAEPGDRVVLGPAEDGGYYLVGLARPHPRLFEGIAWSTAAVLAETLARARELSLEVRLLPSWYDVDDLAALRRLRRELDGPAGPRGAATRALLERLPLARREEGG